VGVIVAIFSLVGFECATAFGEEAHNPLRTIPRAVIASLLPTGAFFIFMTYVETHALANNVPTLHKFDAPLRTLSQDLGVKWIDVLISIGEMISFFALALSSFNAGSRVLFTMGRYGIFPVSLGRSHKENLTPHLAISLFTAIQFIIPTAFILLSYAAIGGWQMAPLDAFNDAGLFVAMGFCGAYVLISLATPSYLKKIGELKIHPIAIAVLSLILLTVPIVGTGYPAPAFPMNYFAYIFIAHLVGGVVVASIRSRSHSEIMASARCSTKPRSRHLYRNCELPKGSFPPFPNRGDLCDGPLRLVGEPPPVPGEVHDGGGPERGTHQSAGAFWRPFQPVVRRGNWKGRKRQEPMEVAEPVQVPCGIHQSTGSRVGRAADARDAS
jgi:amino acid transporter